jgi:hypothetical protein
MTDPAGGQPKRDLADEFQQQMDSFGRHAQAAGERLGREAQAAGDRWSRDPELVSAGTWLTRLIGLGFIAVGLWFFGVVSLRLDLPAIDWDLVWPALLVVVGGLVLVSAVMRRR